MSAPIVENIGQFIESAINDITVANGYNQDLVATRKKRFFLGGEVFNDLNTFILQGKSDNKFEAIEETGPRLVRQEYLIWAVVLQSDKAENVIDTKLNQVRADIEKKLCEDYTCGGAAKQLDIVSCEPTDTPECGVLITVEILFIVAWNNPYIQA